MNTPAPHQIRAIETTAENLAHAFNHLALASRELSNFFHCIRRAAGETENLPAKPAKRVTRKKP